MTEKAPTPNIGVKLILPPEWARRVSGAGPWLEVGTGRPELRADRRRALRLHPFPGGLSAAGTTDWLRSVRRLADAEGELAVVVGGRIPAELREQLEREGVGYLDGQGHLHLAWRGGVIHVGDAQATPQHRSTRTPGPSSVRAIQYLLETDGEFKVADVARATHLSPAQTHAMLTLLEHEGLLRSEGRGPNRRRILGDRSELLDWLTLQPAAVRREKALPCAVYARRPEELFRMIGQQLTEAHVAYGITGAAAASILGTGPTSVPLTAVRIDPEVDLDRAARALGAEPTERGPNVTLLRDTGQTGSLLTTERDGVRLAPKVRVYLDLKRDRRGADLAEQFREVQLGY